MTHYPWLDSYPKNIDWATPIPQKPLFTTLDDAVKTFPNHVAIDFLNKTYSYQTLQELSNQAAAGLQSLAIKKGDKIALCLPNCPQYIIFYFAILKVGATVVNCNPLYSNEELTHILQDADVKIAVTVNLKLLVDKFHKILPHTALQHIIVGDFTEALPKTKQLLFHLFKFHHLSRSFKQKPFIHMRQVMDNEGDFAPVSISAGEDIAVLQYTGGTTGTPKGAALSHAAVYANVHQCLAWFPNLVRGEESILAILPFFHIFSMTAVMHFGLSLGAKLIIHPKFDLIAALKDITQKKPTLMPAVPTLFTAINHYKKIDQYNLSSLKLCISGGAPLPLEVKSSFEALSGCQIVEGYGLTESSPVATINLTGDANQPGSIGLPLPGTVIEIINPQDPTHKCATGEIGEICIKGPQLMLGYYQQEEATQSVLINGFLHTGDVGYIDEKGFIFIVDRIKELIISSGYNIYPRNIEEILYNHPEIEEAAVIGIDDTYRGQVPVAYVVLKPNSKLSSEEILTFLKEKLAAFEIPSHIYFRETLPKTMIGKISKRTLIEQEKIHVSN